MRIRRLVRNSLHSFVSWLRLVHETIGLANDEQGGVQVRLLKPLTMVKHQLQR
jgi:hypothetical protein